MYDIFSNPKLKAIMTLYVIMMGFDLVGRVMIPEPQVQSAAAAAAQNATSSADTSSGVAADIPENGDAIPIDREGFGKIPGSRGKISLTMQAPAVSMMQMSTSQCALDVSTMAPLTS